MDGRRGVLSAGTWCVDLNKTIPAWPVEDTMTYIVEFDRQNGGSGSNMAIDLKRLDPSLPVEAMGVIGDDDDGRFLLGRCEAFGIDSGGLATSARRRLPRSPIASIRSEAAGARISTARGSPRSFRRTISISAARRPVSCTSASPAPMRSWTRRGAARRPAGPRR